MSSHDGFVSLKSPEGDDSKCKGLLVYVAESNSDLLRLLKSFMMLFYYILNRICLTFQLHYLYCFYL